MGLLDLFWILFIISAFSPLIQRRILESKRIATLRKIETSRGSRVIGLIHRQETLSLFGFPLMRYIDIQDSEEVIRAIKMTDDAIPIDIILHTPGGLVLASEQIAQALLRHPAKVTVFIPHYAMSGGTLIALACDEIVMDENAVLGPVDPQVGKFPAASIIHAVDSKSLDKIDDETLILADVSRKAIRQVQRYVERILEGRMKKAESRKLSKALTSGQWTHDYPIAFDEALEIGLSVKMGVPEDVYHFMTLFPQPKARRPSVQYIPIPYHEPPSAGKEK
jgi:ClpP class serine protease